MGARGLHHFARRNGPCSLEMKRRGGTNCDQSPLVQLMGGFAFEVETAPEGWRMRGLKTPGFTDQHAECMPPSHRARLIAKSVAFWVLG